MKIGSSTVPGPYAELHAHSCYSLLDGVPFPEQLAERAAELGLPAIALTDHDAVYGLVPFYRRARELGVKPIIGAEITMEDDSHLTLLAETESGYHNLCRLISAGRMARPKGESRLAWATLAQHTNGLICLTGCRRGPIARHILADNLASASRWLVWLLDIFSRRNLYMELQRNLRRDDIRLSRRLAGLAREHRLQCVATGNVHYLTREDADLQAVLVSIRERIPLPKIGTGRNTHSPLRPNHEYHLRSPETVYALFSDLPEAVRNTLLVAERCTATLPTGLQTLPQFPTPHGLTADDYLRQLCESQLTQHYSRNHLQAKDLLAKELAIITQLGLANYFLVVWDIINFCQRRGILCHGRGSAANSLVANLLGISAVDPIAQGLVVERFLSVEHGGTPDIDLDIDAAQRESVIQYVYDRWGRDHAAMACTYITYRSASAIRDAGFALGFNPDTIEEIATAIEGERRAQELDEDGRVEHLDISVDQLTTGLFDQQTTRLKSPEWQRLINIAERLRKRPRHLGLHNGGMIVTGEPIASLMPIELATMPDRTVVQFDKEWLEQLGIVKIDLLGLRMLSAISDTVKLVRETRRHRLDLHSLKFNDKRVYDHICSAKTIGLFQVESGAQVSVIPQLQPRCFQDLVVEVSLIRPGPLQGNMVRPYLRRRNGQEPVAYPHPSLESALADTLGVIIFQEQVIKIARDFAGFTPGRGELLRRALGSKNASEALTGFHAEFLQGALAQGITQPTAENVWEMIAGFAGYSFSKAHASAFAVIVYWSAWLRVHFPAEYFCGLLRNAPLGTYPPNVLESEARRNGIRFLPFDINRSKAKATVEASAIRFGLDYIKGIGSEQAGTLVEIRGGQPYRSLVDFIERTKLDRRRIESLILAGAFDSLGERRQLLWDLAEAFDLARRPRPLPLHIPDEQASLLPMADDKKLVLTFTTTDVTAGLHLVEVRKDSFTRAGCWPYHQLLKTRLGSKVKVGGLVADGVRRPPTANGTAFLRLDSPDGIMDVIIPEELYLKFHDTFQSAFLVVEGKLQKQHPVVSILAKKVEPLK